jgi:hypothetical protein
MGVEPIPSASQADVPTAYTTDTIKFSAEGEGIEPSRPSSSAGFQPGPVANRVALPFFTYQQPDQDLNLEHLVRSET